MIKIYKENSAHKSNPTMLLYWDLGHMLSSLICIIVCWCLCGVAKQLWSCLELQKKVFVFITITFVIFRIWPTQTRSWSRCSYCYPSIVSVAVFLTWPRISCSLTSMPPLVSTEPSTRSSGTKWAGIYSLCSCWEYCSLYWICWWNTAIKSMDCIRR